MNSENIVCIDSDQDDDVCIISSQPRPKLNDSGEVIIIEESEKVHTNGGPVETIELDPEPGPSSSSSSSSRTLKRVKPTLISSEVTSPSKKKEFGKEEAADKSKKRPKVPKGDFGSFKRTRIMRLSDNALDLEGNSDEEQQAKVIAKKAPLDTSSAAATDEKITKEFRKLIQTCKAADGSMDMEKCIRKKLLGYYREVPPDFVASKSFKDVCTAVTEEIKKVPHLVYLKLNSIVDELKPRRRTVLVKQEIVEGESENGEAADADAAPPPPTAAQLEKNEKKTAQIKKLNKALAQLKKRIDELDKEEVDFDEDVNSAHMKVERYKKRACQIYEKLCDISGESKHAQRSVRKPIKFHGTVYPEFNKTLQAFVNRTNIFPDYFDVKKCLEHCNKTYNMKLRPEEIKATAQDAFVKVGKILQKRRKIDLYEMISYFTGADTDPADEDADLQDKLGKNKQHHSKISDLIDKFASEQGHNGAVQAEEEDTNGADGNPGEDNAEREEEEREQKFDPSTMLAAANISGGDDPLNQSLDLFADQDDGGSKSNDDIDSLPIQGGDKDPLKATTSTEDPLKEPSDNPPASTSSTDAADPNQSNNENTSLHDTVNMDEAIEFMVTNSYDPFAIPEMDMDLLQDLPMTTEDLIKD